MTESVICFLLEIFVAVTIYFVSNFNAKFFLNKSSFKHKNVIILIMTVIGFIMMFIPCAVIFYQIHWGLIWNFL